MVKWFVLRTPLHPASARILVRDISNVRSPHSRGSAVYVYPVWNAEGLPRIYSATEIA